MRSAKILAVVMLFGVIAGFAGVPAAAQKGKMVSVPAGTAITVRMLDSVDSSKNSPGTKFAATLDANVTSNGVVLVPKGNTVYGRVANAQQAGNATGSSALQLELTDIIIGGTPYAILTTDYQVKGSSSSKRSAKRLLGGTGLGAAIGAIAGNAGMGAAIGATAGAVGSVAQKGKAVSVPSETLISFTLKQPVSLPVP